MLTKEQLEEMELCMMEEKAECWKCSLDLTRETCEKQLLNTAIALMIENEKLKGEI